MKNRTDKIRLVISVMFVLLACQGVRADGTVEVNAIKVTEHVYMLTGQGGNIGLVTGEEGIFMIDDQFAPLTDKIVQTIAKIQPGPIRFLLNTHWHFDHTGGNENFGGMGAIIVAHDNVRKRLSTDQFIEFFQKKVPATKPVGLPMITFAEDMTFHLNGFTLHVTHAKNAHTDGDGIIHIKEANVVHTGDIYFNGLYPFIDVGSGGSIDGMIAAVDVLLQTLDASSKIIPGHGPLSNKAELQDYRAMLANVRQQVKAGIDAGKDLAAIQSEKPTQKFDEKWGGGFLSPDKFTELVYQSFQ